MLHVLSSHNLLCVIRGGFLGAILLLAGAPAASADTQCFRFDPQTATVEGSIRYTVVGKYRASFEEYSGLVRYNREKDIIDGVELTIRAGSIRSSWETLDNIVRSPQILDTEKFPTIEFYGDTVSRQAQGYTVTGRLALHGQEQERTFDFTAQPPRTTGGTTVLPASGSWIISRKDYGIIWNKLLDHGGILVGNHITVDWRVEAVPAACPEGGNDDEKT